MHPWFIDQAWRAAAVRKKEISSKTTGDADEGLIGYSSRCMYTFRFSDAMRSCARVSDNAIISIAIKLWANPASSESFLYDT